MKDGKLSTDPYRGVRDFYPEDMAIQSHIYDTWSKVCESFGFERYDASVLEPSELYKSKGAENEEMVNEQTYTFMDRGDREVTLRPEMTPTVARMVAGRRRELALPIRWYSIPNLFRYERAQRGRLREHWQLNADIFGSTDTVSDVEIILLGASIFKALGAAPTDYEIRINDRSWLNGFIEELGLTGDAATEFINLLDRKEKIDTFDAEAEKMIGKPLVLPTAPPPGSNLERVIESLRELGVSNVVFSASTVRGFNYYTGTVFEIFDTHPDNRRALLGGGRYDNLTALFGGDPIPAVGFGMGDVALKDFLETHKFLPANLLSVDLAVIPLNPENALDAEKIAQQFRDAGKKVYVSLAHKKVGDQIKVAEGRNARFILVVGGDEIGSGSFKLKELSTGTETAGDIATLIGALK